MNIDRLKLYDSEWEFFKPSGQAVMKLAPSTAVSVCLKAAAHRMAVVGVEGGILHSDGFEPRLDCIWDSKADLIDQAGVRKNNIEAAEFIERKRHVHNAFIITVSQLTDQ
jgi:hypothetical protein